MTSEHIFMSRRGAIKAALGAGAVLLGGSRLLGAAAVPDGLAAGACALTAEQTEGPFYVALNRIRSNIKGTRKGLPLALGITVIDSGTCKPIRGAAVDIWHADAAGHYSDEAQEGTVGQTWLRGIQLTNAAGLARFATIYPGFYSGRAPHIHVKVHVGGSNSSSRYRGGHVAHTGQIFFPETLSTKAYKRAAYRKDTNARTYNKSDSIYTGQHGASSIMRVTGGSASSGLRGAITLAVDSDADR